MAGEFAKFFIRLASVFDPKGLKQAEGRIKKTDKAVEGIGAQFKKLGAMFLGGAAIWKMVNFARASIDAMAQEELAIKKVNEAMRTAGDYSIQASESVQKFADEMERTAGISNEVVLNQFALAKSFIC